MKVLFVFWLHLLLVVLFVQVSWASPTTMYEKEPNNTPVEATHFYGEIRLTGLLDKGDQDAYMWELDEKNSQYLWDIELVGVPHAMTRIDIMQVTFSPDGKEVLDYKKFFSFGTRTGDKPIHLKHLLFTKGAYLIAVSSKSKNESNIKHNYQINFIKDRKASKGNLEKRKNARNISSTFYPYLFKKNTGWFSFEVEKEESQKLWTLSGVTTIGHPLNVVLEDKSRHVLFQTSANKFGKFKFVDLELDEGKYYLKYSTDSEGTKNAATLYSTGTVKIDSNEVEPNNDSNDANTISYRKTIHGKADKDGDYDYFSFKLPFNGEDKLFDLKLVSNDKNLKFYLKDSEDHTLQEKGNDNNYTMTNLRLEPNKAYYIAVYSYNKDANYSFKFSDFKEANLSEEVEPNDDVEHAYAIPLKEVIYGYLQGEEDDCFVFDIVSANKIWNIAVTGEKVEQLELYKGIQSNNRMFDIRKSEHNPLAIKNLLLLPGKYSICLYGDSTLYTLRIQELNLSDINVTSISDIEHEPNQNKRQTNALHFGQTIKGILENRGNEDYFHFTLHNKEHIRLTAIPPKDGDIRFKITSNIIEHSARPKIGEKALIEGIYPAGRYTLEAWTDKPSYGLYSLKLERLNIFDGVDKEPNDDYKRAGYIPPNFQLKGHSNAKDDDYYKFPSFMNNETNITISGEKLKNHIALYSKNKDFRLSLKWDKEKGTYTARVKAPATSYLMVENGVGYYDYNLSFTAYQPKIQKPLNLSADVQKVDTKIAAYSEYGQKIHFSVLLESEESYRLKISSHSSDMNWKVEGIDKITLKPHAQKRVPFTIDIPKSVEEKEVLVSLKFSNEDGSFKIVSLYIHPKQCVTPLNIYDDWGLPDALLGGLNVARLDFGAERIVEHNESEPGYVKDIMVRAHLLFDDFVYKGTGFHLYDRRKLSDEHVTIKLLGDRAQEIVGVMLNPIGERNDREQLKSFSIGLSEDGKNYTTVYHGTLGLQTQDQAFSFDKTYKAKYARLILHNNYENDTKGEIGLGEWKVIAKQKHIALKKPFNIANPKFGGHVVKASKVLSTNWDRNILTPKDDIGGSDYLYKKDKVLSWVVGFKNERVAKITALRWKEGKGSKKAEWIKNIHVLVSTQTPNGPWNELFLWKKSDANVSLNILKKPEWARYVKFVYDIQKDGDKSLPETLQIFEEKPSKTYKSILGEWGEKSHRSFYEYIQQKRQQAILVITGNDTKEDAYNIEVNETVKGIVSVFNHEEDWYKIIVQQENVLFSATLSGASSVDVLYELYDANGTKINLFNQQKEPQKHVYKYDLHKGTYWAKVKQPPVSVVFAWDNSGSVSPYHTQIFDAVNNYTQTIQTKIDAVNLLCFNYGENLILDNFSDNPSQIQTIFNNFDRDCSDSDAEKPLKKASEVLMHRDGIKGVIIIGDAVGSRDIKLWDTLKEVKPKVFSIRVQSQYRDNDMYEGIMQSWSRVNNGTYNVVSNGTELYRAINRASAILRRPVYYTLQHTSKYKKPKGPGTLKLMFDERKKAPVNNHFSVELILDASGSMLKKIHGKRRIAIARDVLKKAVRDIIPPKTLVALRVFGHKQADSCRTDLEVKLQPLDAYRMMQRISQVNAKNLAKTPIADSLAKVAEDLKSVKGKKVVILVTDGEETCDGDPAKVIADLKEKGIDIRVNIVGFAIDNMALKEKFRQWAKIGNGSYFDARDQRSLDAAVVKALQVPYKVYDKQGKILAKSTVGSKPIVLPEGVYKIVVESAIPVVYEGIIVHGEQQNQVLLQHEGIK